MIYHAELLTVCQMGWCCLCFVMRIHDEARGFIRCPNLHIFLYYTLWQGLCFHVEMTTTPLPNNHPTVCVLRGKKRQSVEASWWQLPLCKRRQMMIDEVTSVAPSKLFGSVEKRGAKPTSEQTGCVKALRHKSQRRTWRKGCQWSPRHRWLASFTCRSLRQTPLSSL